MGCHGAVNPGRVRYSVSTIVLQIQSAAPFALVSFARLIGIAHHVLLVLLHAQAHVRIRQQTRIIAARAVTPALRGKFAAAVSARTWVSIR